MCDEHVETITCAFNNCYYRYISRIEQNNRIKRVKSDWIRVGDFYSRFNEDNQVSYASLVIETKSINNGSCFSLTEPIGCIYCLCKFDLNDADLVEKVTFDRVDYFHENCKNDLEEKL